MSDPTGSAAQGDAGADARRLHAQFELGTWQTTKDYPDARYTLTRTSEFFPQATIGRRGPVVPLERAIRPSSPTSWPKPSSAS